MIDFIGRAPTAGNFNQILIIWRTSIKQIRVLINTGDNKYRKEMSLSQTSPYGLTMFDPSGIKKFNHSEFLKCGDRITVLDVRDTSTAESCEAISYSEG